MQNNYNPAAKSNRKMAPGRWKRNLLVLLIVIVSLIAAYFIETYSRKWGIWSIVAGLSLGIRLFMYGSNENSRKQRKLIRRAGRGADTEDEIGGILLDLDDSFMVLRDLQSPYGVIDHVVISQKGGIILLQSQYQRGLVTTSSSNILVNGFPPKQSPVAQVLSTSLWLRDEIGNLLYVKPWVTSFMVFTRATVVFVKPVKGVQVMHCTDLLKNIEALSSQNATNASIWKEREKIADHLVSSVNNPGYRADFSTHACPQCGKRLSLRKAQRGDQAGKSFWVCPDYPKCHTAILADQPGPVIG